MGQSVAPEAIAQIQECLSLTHDFSRHAEASEAFAKLQSQFADTDPLAAQLLGLLWEEMLAARRSAVFWEQISNIERGLTEEMTAHHLQLQQNYLRLVQEQ